MINSIKKYLVTLIRQKSGNKYMYINYNISIKHVQILRNSNPQWPKKCRLIKELMSSLMLRCIMVNTCFTDLVWIIIFLLNILPLFVMAIFFSLVLKLSVVLAFVFVMPISTVHVYKIIILAVPTMIAKLKKASTLTSRSGNLLLDSIQGSSANAKNGCLANVVHRTSIFHQK